MLQVASWICLLLCVMSSFYHGVHLRRAKNKGDVASAVFHGVYLITNTAWLFLFLRAVDEFP